MTRRFNIKRGSATFINSTELNPTLQGTAEYEVKQPNREAINIQIVVGGTLRTPNISLTSDAQPPIPQSDLLSYLAFGRSSSSLVQLEGSGLTNGSGGSNLVGAGAALASRQLAGIAIGVAADQFAGEAARSLGVERLYSFGALAALAAESFGEGAESYRDAGELARALDAALSADVHVLVKGSRVNRLERVVDALLAHDATRKAS